MSLRTFLTISAALWAIALAAFWIWIHAATVSDDDNDFWDEPTAPINLTDRWGDDWPKDAA